LSNKKSGIDIQSYFLVVSAAAFFVVSVAIFVVSAAILEDVSVVIFEVSADVVVVESEPVVELPEPPPQAAKNADIETITNNFFMLNKFRFL
jgi:uncharacterized protein involved in exopolysaccharide biosynthesis